MKLFRNSTFRLVLASLVLVAMTIIPLFFILYYVPELWILALVLSVVFGVGGAISLILMHHFIQVKPTRLIIKGSRNITKGEYVNIEKGVYDKDLKELIGALNSTAFEFENLEQMRKSFVSNASHELRSPLTSIQGFLQAILDGTIPRTDYNKYLQIVFRETKRLTALINSMLDLSRMESGRNPVVMSRFDLNATIKAVVERFEAVLIKKECLLDVDFAREFSYVFADREKIIQVIVNLIDNAIKYSPPKSRVTVTTNLQGKKVFVSVKDRGFGISKKDQFLIWDRFYMVDKAHTPTKNKGTGLGLSIVKKIIDDHSEQIWVESAKGTGSTFIFSLSSFDLNRHKVDVAKKLAVPEEKTQDSL